MKQRIIALSEAHPRYGYRRIGALLRREGQRVNPKRVQRIRRQEGLQVRKNQHATRRVGISTALRQRAERANHVWSWDIIHDQTQAGSTLRILTLIDEYAKQCLAIEVGRSIRAVDAIRSWAERSNATVSLNISAVTMARSSSLRRSGNG
jgi:hypothetical protein